MATKKSSKKSGGGKKSAVKKGAGKKGGVKAAKTRTKKKPAVNGLPPVILGGGGSIVIYSTEPLIAPNPGEVTNIAGYTALIHPDRSKNIGHTHQKRNGRTVHRHGVEPDDRIEIEDV